MIYDAWDSKMLIPFTALHFLVIVIAVDIILVVCVTEAPFLAKCSLFLCTFHITICDRDQNVKVARPLSPVFKLSGS